MLILWSLNGIAQFAVWPAIVKIITTHLAPEDRKDGAFYIAFASVGGLLVSYVTAALITRWEYNFLVSGGVLLGLFLMWIAECHNVDHFMIADADLGDEKITQEIREEKNGKLFWRSGFYFIIFYFCNCLYNYLED